MTSTERPAEDPSRPYRIEPDTRHSPQIGALLEMLAYARLTTLQAVQGLSVEQLDATPPGFRNSIGMLLAHIAAVDRVYHWLSFGGRDPFTESIPEFDPYRSGLTMGAEGEPVRGRPLAWYLDELETSRGHTLATLAQRDDAWLASRLSVPGFDFPNHHWAWFHVMEDEVSHRGQIRLLRNIVAPKPAATAE
ncbi:DinB family protein [Deinococcus phoenicis]|nr:DinB family protein [Deinococcus phoenicis]